MTKISVYIDDGRVFEYEVKDPIKGREHAHKIVMQGYRHTPHGEQYLEYYPAHRIDKVKVEGGAESSKYQDFARAT